MCDPALHGWTVRWNSDSGLIPG